MTNPLSYTDIENSELLFTVCSAINAKLGAKPGEVGLPWVTPPGMTDARLVAEIAAELDYATDDVKMVITLLKRHRNLI